MSKLLRIGTLVSRWAVTFVLLALAGCMNMYVDGTTKEIIAAEFKKPDKARPVQVLFEFQTKGVANGRATELLKARVLEQVKSSGLFGTITETPAPGGALLGLTLNNVPLTDDGFSKGFVTGLTFGLAGSSVSDGYVCIARYSSGLNAETTIKQSRHAIHSTFGVAASPGNATLAGNPEVAVTLMTRQILSNVLYDLSRDPAFK